MKVQKTYLRIFHRVDQLTSKDDSLQMGQTQDLWDFIIRVRFERCSLSSNDSSAIAAQGASTPVLIISLKSEMSCSSWRSPSGSEESDSISSVSTSETEKGESEEQDSASNWFPSSGVPDSIRAESILGQSLFSFLVIIEGQTGPGLGWDPLTKPFGTALEVSTFVFISERLFQRKEKLFFEG